MPDPTDHSLVSGLLTSLSLRTHAETVVLTARLRERCWPGGDDRTDEPSRESLRRAGAGDALEPVGCTCGSGRCRVCN